MLERVPFSKDKQLCSDLDFLEDIAEDDKKLGLTSLPGHPSISLANVNRLGDFLAQELCAHDLDRAASHLWVLATHSSHNVHPVHEQRLKGRDIVLTEYPRLHLVWLNDRIFIKPLPAYLASYAFWKVYLLSPQSPLGPRREVICRAALGFLRTYWHLIRYESDLLAVRNDEIRLVQPEVSWEMFNYFISSFAGIDDGDVSQRYQYGELRLSRLNSYAPLLFGRSYFYHVHGQYGDYFARLYGPFFFAFALLSTILNSMQVALAARQVLEAPPTAMFETMYIFALISLGAVVLVLACFVALWLWMLIDEWIYAIKQQYHRPKGKRRSAQQGEI